jgi:lipoprotein signal peptidase
LPSRSSSNSCASWPRGIDFPHSRWVVDFLHFDLWGGYSWPDFNLADTWIVVGVGLLVLELLASEGEERSGVESGESNG